MKYIASCSFGKDSIATILLAREHNEPLDEIVYCEVMFDENISGELPEHRDFIYNVAIPKFEEWGYKVTVLRSEKNYLSIFEKPITRSKIPERNGKKYGFPMSKGCWVNSRCKTPPIDNYWKNQNVQYTQYIGIAIDEPIRLQRLTGTNRTSLLEKYGYTEEMAKQKCIEYGLLSPIYEFTNRNGCWFCMHQKKKELRHLYDNHKDLWDKLLGMSLQDVMNPYFYGYDKITFKQLDEQFRLEDAQMTIFDFLDD